MYIKIKYNSTLYPLTRDTSYDSAGQNHIESYIVKDVCIDNPGNINKWEDVTEESCSYMVFLLQQFGIFAD